MIVMNAQRVNHSLCPTGTEVRNVTEYSSRVSTGRQMSPHQTLMNAFETTGHPVIQSAYGSRAYGASK